MYPLVSICIACRRLHVSCIGDKIVVTATCIDVKKRFLRFLLFYKKKRVFNVFFIFATFFIDKNVSVSYVLEILEECWFYCGSSVIERSISLICPVSGGSSAYIVASTSRVRNCEKL